VRRIGGSWAASTAAGVALCAWLLAACAARTSRLPAAADLLPPAGAVAGWQRDGQVRTYNRGTLYDFMDGAADLYFTYGFEQLAVAHYVHPEAGSLQVEVYRVATDADAYGLYTYTSFGEPIAMGVDGELDGGNRLAFWQARTFVQVIAREQVPGDVLRGMATAVASALPPGSQRPSLVDHLPQGGLRTGSVRFFREKMALDNLLWLGAQDPLALGPDVEGIIAGYDLAGQPVELVLIAYPDKSRAQLAQSGLQAAAVENLIAVELKGTTVGAVFGSPDIIGAADLLAQTMSTLQ
jgi:Family of unknown function (DUF6599)